MKGIKYSYDLTCMDISQRALKESLVENGRVLIQLLGRRGSC
jgi:hypothetical protein